MLTFYFVRHGIKESLPFDPPLTELGVKQAELTAKHLQNIPFKAIVASHKLRTQQTARAIAKHLKLPVLTDSRLQERLEWENDQTFDEFVVEWDKTDIDRKYQPKKGTSSHENGKQMKKIIDELSNKYSEGNVVIVSHGGTIGDLLRNLFGEGNLIHRTWPVSGGKYISIVECSVTVVQRDEDNYKLLRISDVSHLSALGSKS